MQWIVPILFFVIGFLIKYKKAYWLIAGYHTAFREEQSKMDADRTGRLAGNCCLLLGMISLTGSLLRYFDYKVLGDLTWVLFLGVMIYLLLRSQRYAQPNSKLVATTAKTFVLIMLLPLLVIFIMLAYGMAPAGVTLEEEALIIEGTYGVVIPYEQIQAVELLDEIPKVLKKVNGFNLGNLKKGVFQVEGWGNGRLQLEEKGGPYLYVVYLEAGRPEFFLMNQKDQEAVIGVYEALAERMNQSFGKRKAND